MAMLLACGSDEPSARGSQSAGSTSPQTSTSASAPATAPSAVASVSGLASASAAPTQPAAGPSTSNKATVAFVGDIALSMHVSMYMNPPEGKPSEVEEGYPFAAVAEQLRSYDLLVGNLECVVANRGSPTIPLPLTAPLHSPKVLLDAGFDMVSVANNHAEDLGKLGYEDMLKRLDAAGLPYVGGYLADKTRDPMLVREVNGVKIAVLGYFNRSTEDSYADLKRAKELADVVLVYLHWGIDFGPHPTRFQRQWGRKLIDAGASAVIGAHSHIVQPEEIYEGKLIAHSLGNFVFSGMTKRGSRDGAILELDVDKTGVTKHRFRPVKLDLRGAPSLNGEPRETAPLTPDKPRPLTPLGEPIDFNAVKGYR